MNEYDIRKYANYWYQEVGVNVIRVDSKSKVPLESWKGWQDKSIPIELHADKVNSGKYESGIAIITGEIRRGVNKGKFLFCVDLDNKKGIEEFLIKTFDLFHARSIEELSQKTVVEQHSDAKDRAHIYLVTELQIQKRGRILASINNKTSTQEEIPAMELKSDSSTLAIVSPSIHKNGFPYEIIGNRVPTVLNTHQSEKLDLVLLNIYKEFGNSDENKQVSTLELFDDKFTIIEGQNRQDAVLRVCDSLIQRLKAIYPIEKIKKLSSEWNQDHCKPPLEIKEFEDKWSSALKFIAREDKTDTNNSEKKNKNNSELLMEVAEEKIDTLFKDQFGEGFTRINVNIDHLEIISLNSNRFTRFISKSFFEKFGYVLGRETINNVVQILQAKAEFGDIKYDLFLKVAKYDDDFYYDLTNEKHQCIRIFRNKENGFGQWEILDKTPIPLFKRFNQIPQDLPSVYTEDLQHKEENSHSDKLLQRSADPLDLFLIKLTNIKDDKTRLLVKISLMTYFIPDIPHVIMLVHGSKGSAKSTFLRMLKDIVEPAKPPLFTLHYKSEEFIQQLAHNYFSAFDNIKYVPKWLSDEVCKAVTGIGQTKREIYTVDNDKIYEYKHCLIFNGINLAFSEPDVLDRSIIIYLNEIDDKDRMTEEDILEEFNNLKPHLLKFIFDTFGKAMVIKEDVKDRLKKSGRLPRMSDYAVWSEAISQSLGNKEGQFLDAYHSNLSLQNEEIIESSIVSKVVIEFMEDRAEWNGSATDLYLILTSMLSDKNDRLIRSKAWPNSANSLSRKINELASTLKKRGIEITHSYDNKTKSRVIRIINIEKISLLSSYRSSDLVDCEIMSKQDPNDFLPLADPDEDNKKVQSDEITEILGVGSKEPSKQNQDTDATPSIHQIADRIHEHSDIWVCKNCDHKGDKWDLLSHIKYCKNSKK